MKKILLVLLTLIMFLSLAGCSERLDESLINEESSSQSEDSPTKETSSAKNTENNEKSEEMKLVRDNVSELKSVNINKDEKNKIVQLFLNRGFVFGVSVNTNFTLPSEIRIVEKWDEYNYLCYSIYKYKNDKLFTFILREKPDSTRSTFQSLTTVYDGILIMPIDKVYTIEDFKEIVINKSDLSDVKKIYKYADILFEQELRESTSKKKCSIDILSIGSGITISFKKKRGKYIVTNIEDNTDGWLVSKIADVDKNFD